MMKVISPAWYKSLLDSQTETYRDLRGEGNASSYSKALAVEALYRFRSDSGKAKLAPDDKCWGADYLGNGVWLVVWAGVDYFVIDCK